MRAARPLPLINMRLILRRIEQARLRRNVGIAAAWAQPPVRARLAVDRASRLPSPKRSVRRFASRASRARVRVVPSRPRDPDIAFRSGRSGGQAPPFSTRRSAARQADDALVEKIAAKSSRDQVKITAGASCTRGKRPGQSFTDVVQALRNRREDGLRLGPAADSQVEAFAAALGRRERHCCARCESSPSWPNSSLRTGTAISAAAVGVGARRSAAWSISVVSVSCPTAEISGIGQSAAARTTSSSLNGHRSSIEPPPRATIKKVGLRLD